jgi:GST-like protein
MIDLYYWPTPNGHKVTMFLEEAGLPYTIHPVDIGKGAQFEPSFLKIAPNNRMPAIVDQAPADGGGPVSLFESGAILLYLAEKTGRFLPADLRGRAETLQWLFWQMGGLGPMLGQNHHFSQYAPEKIPYAIDRYVKETNRLYGVLDRRLADREFVAGAGYTIADMAAYPWIVPWEKQGQRLDDHPNLKRWFEAIADRPRYQGGLRARGRGQPEPRPADERGRQAGDVRPDRVEHQSLRPTARCAGRPPWQDRQNPCRRRRGRWRRGGCRAARWRRASAR